MSCTYVPRPLRFNTFINDSLEKKKFQQTREFWNPTLNCKKNVELTKIYISFAKFQEKIFVHFHFLSMLYMFKETPKAIPLVNFGLFGENFVTSFVSPKIKKTEIQSIRSSGRSMWSWFWKPTKEFSNWEFFFLGMKGFSLFSALEKV